MASVLHQTIRFSSQRNRVMLVCCAIMGLLLGGCFHEIGVPIWTKDTVVFYPDLVGQYHIVDGTAACQLTAGEDKTYTVSHFDAKGLPTPFLDGADKRTEVGQLRFVKLGEFTFMSYLIFKPGTKEYEEFLAQGFGIPQLVSRVSFNGKDITLWYLPRPESKEPYDHDVLLDHAEIRTKEVVVRDAKTGESKKKRTIDMTTAELQAFLKKHGAEFTQKTGTYKWIGPVR